MTQRNKVHQLITEQETAHLKRPQEFLAQPSVSQDNPEGVRKCADLLSGYFQELGCQETELVDTMGLLEVWAHYDAGAAKTVAIYGFFDTNVVGSDWAYPPYEAAVAELSPLKKVVYGPRRGQAARAGW